MRRCSLLSKGCSPVLGIEKYTEQMKVQYQKWTSDAFYSLTGGESCLDVQGFVRMCRICKFLDSTFTAEDARQVVLSSMPSEEYSMAEAEENREATPEAAIDIDGFLCALGGIAEMRGLSQNEVV